LRHSAEIWPKLVSGDDVDLLSYFSIIHGIKRRELLGQPTRSDHIAVADSAFVLVGEIETSLLSTIGRTASRNAGGAGEQHIDLILVEEPSGELLNFELSNVIIGDQPSCRP
jgi:hypothetical protein